MIAFEVKAQRGTFQLEAAGTFSAPWTVIAGAAGAGKSLLCRILSGLEDSDSGRISVHGRYVTDTATGLQLRPGAKERGVGMVMERAALFPHLTVAANVAYGLKGSSLAEVRGGCEDLLDLVDLKDLADRFPKALSAPEAQRVALARALAPAPELLLLDEPLSALDRGERRMLLDRLSKALAERKIQAIFTTRDEGNTQRGWELIRLREGRLAGRG